MVVDSRQFTVFASNREKWSNQTREEHIRYCCSDLKSFYLFVHNEKDEKKNRRSESSILAEVEILFANERATNNNNYNNKYFIKWHIIR